MRRHGTYSSYGSGCRCEPCKEAKRAYARQNHHRRMRERFPGWTPDRRRAQHGTNSKYATGCRCAPCTEAHRRYRLVQSRREGYRARVGAGPSRALTACMAGFGVAKKAIAGATGCSEVTLALKRATVLSRTAERVEGIHWALWRQHAAFRRHCTCEMPGWMREWMEAA